MKLSICLPLYNRRELLRWGLASLCWWQSADRGSYEIIIADDGSTDDPGEVIREFEGDADIKYVYVGPKLDEGRNNGGPARNVAMRHASGDIIAQSEPEIVHLGESITAVLALHEKRRKVMGLCGKWWRVHGDPETLQAQRAALAAADVRSRACFEEHMRPVWQRFDWRGAGRHNPPQVFLSVHRKFIIDRLNGYDERFWMYGGEDGDLLARLKNCRLEVVEQPEVVCVHLGHTKRGPWDKQQHARQRAMISATPVRRNEGTWLGARQPERSEKRDGEDRRTTCELLPT